MGQLGAHQLPYLYDITLRSHPKRNPYPWTSLPRLWVCTVIPINGAEDEVWDTENERGMGGSPRRDLSISDTYRVGKAAYPICTHGGRNTRCQIAAPVVLTVSQSLRSDYMWYGPQQPFTL